MGRILGCWLLALMLLASPVLRAAPEIVASGLFKDRAMLTIDGEARLLRVGEVSPEGVELVSSSSREAVIEVDGRRHKLGLSTRIAATYRDADVAEVRIPRGSDSHYMAGGSINGHPVTMLVDTGATLVAMNVHDARRLGVQFRNGRRGTASTAGGRVDTFVVNLNTVRIGGLEVRNVSAAVLVGDYPETILLGNSLLDRLEMSQEAGVLVLRKKY